MAFVKERIPDEKLVKLNTLGIRNWTGKKPYLFLSGDYWCVDMERKSFLLCLGGGHDNDPYFWVLWWNDLEIRIEESGERLEFAEDGKIVRKITQITIPKEALSMRDVIFALIKEAFSVQDEDKIITKIMCNHNS